MNTNLPPILDFGSTSNPNNGTLFDTRDGQTYKVVKIGNQIWLAENFRYLPSIKEKGDLYENSWVYENNNDYLDLHYGRLYDWNTAMSIAPAGWKLPSNEDFQELIDFVKEDNDFGYGKDRVGSYLKSVNGWEPCDGIKPNNDKYGFSAKPAGCYVKKSKIFYDANGYASFWSATKSNSDSSYSCCLFYNKNEVFRSYEFSSRGFSVRLIKDH
jgi:uncharacterized protein (TIGR02145 family)